MKSKRIVLLFFAAVFCSVMAFGQNNFIYEPVLLTIDSMDGQYACGDTVKVYGMLTDEAPSDLTFVVEANGKVISRPAPAMLKKGEKVQLIGFGTFEVRERGARTGRNPQTGATIEIAASKVPAFVAGKGLKDAIK